jgi:hypothetical protein
MYKTLNIFPRIPEAGPMPMAVTRVRPGAFLFQIATHRIELKRIHVRKYLKLGYLRHFSLARGLPYPIALILNEREDSHAIGQIDYQISGSSIRGDGLCVATGPCRDCASTCTAVPGFSGARGGRRDPETSGRIGGADSLGD